MGRHDWGSSSHPGAHVTNGTRGWLPARMREAVSEHGPVPWESPGLVSRKAPGGLALLRSTGSCPPGVHPKLEGAVLGEEGASMQHPHPALHTHTAAPESPQIRGVRAGSLQGRKKMHICM